MPLLGKISTEAQNTLTEAKMIKAEEGPSNLKKLVEKVTSKAAKADKTELVHMSNYDIFLTFIYVLNSDNFTYSETVGYCEEAKKMINGWTFEKDGKRLNTCIQKTNEDGSLTDWTCTTTLTELGLTPVFVNYSMKFVYVAMYHFLKLKKDILTQSDHIKKLPLPQRMKWLKDVYKNSTFSNFVVLAKDILADAEKDHAFRQDVSSKRISATEEVLKSIENGTIESIIEIPKHWHQYLDPRVLEPLYEVVQANLISRKIELDKEEQDLLSKRNKSDLTKYLYDNNLDPYSLPEEKLSLLESIPNIVSKIEFFKYIGIPINDSLTTFYESLINITEEQINTLTFLLSSNVLSKNTLKEKLSLIITNYQQLISNYEILKDIIDFNNIFYNDTILLKDIKEIKAILSILKEYKLSLNNYIFLLCNYEYIDIYDLMLEQNIPLELFISICKTEEPLNTIKRIIVYRSIGESYVTPNNFLRKEVTSESKFICKDEDLDEYIPNIVEENGLNLLHGSSISTIVDNNIVKELDTEYQNGNTYIIGDTTISRPKFLRNFESAQGNPNYLIISLISGSILSEKEYYDITNEIHKHKLKK